LPSTIASEEARFDEQYYEGVHRGGETDLVKKRSRGTNEDVVQTGGTKETKTGSILSQKKGRRDGGKKSSHLH